MGTSTVAKLFRYLGHALAVSILLALRLALAQEPSCVLTASQTQIAAGGQARVGLCCFNESPSNVPVLFRSQLNGTLVSGVVSAKVELHLNGERPASVTLAPGQFAKREYIFDLPQNIHGSAILTAGNFNPVVIQIDNAATEAAPSVAASPSAPPATSNGTFGSSFGDYFGRHISPYEPIYFLLGTYPAAEFQFSLKYKVLDLDSDWNPFAHAYFAYTQVSFWDVLNEDPSFYDTSYKPSGFLFYTNVNRGDRFRLDLQGGVEHESNGRGGEMERALNTAYLQPTLKFALSPTWELSLQPRVWDYLSVHRNNEDLSDYRGYADLRCNLDWLDAVTREKRFEVATRFRIGDQGEHASWLIDVRYNLPRAWIFNPAIDLQYFTGYGQTLRQYNQASYGFRGGLCLWY